MALMKSTSAVVNETDTLPLEDIDYIEIYSGNAKQAAFYYCALYGFRITGYSGLETGNREKVSYLLEQGDMRIVMSSSYVQDHPISKFVYEHGDGVRDIAFRVADVEETYQRIMANGGISLLAPQVEEDEHGVLKRAVFKAFGDTVHTLIERANYDSKRFAPGFEMRELPESESDEPPVIARFDHIAINVESIRDLADYYEKAFGLKNLNEFKKEDISSSNSALMAKALQNGTERIKFTLVEPAEGKKRSQIHEFLQYNNGPGVQHIAFLTDDILLAVETLRNNGTNFLYTPDSYYDMLPNRVGDIDEPLDELNRLNILVDRDEEGYLLQIFGPALDDRPTMFFEVIQRKGSRGFGNGNIKALFEAVEREQARRGNL